jgi:hypothetical protein
MSKRRAANTVNRMEIFQKKRNLSVPKTKIDSIIVLVKATRSLTLENEITGSDGDTPAALAQGKSMCYELPVINAISGKPPREPQGGGEHTVRVATVLRPTHRIRLVGGDGGRHRAMRS